MSQCREAADSNIMRLDDVNQITSISCTCKTLSETDNMVLPETQNTFHNTDNDIINVSMRPSSVVTQTMVLSPSCVIYDSLSGTDVDVNYQSPAVHEDSYTDSLLSQDRDHSSTVQSSQVSDNTFNATQLDDTAANLSTSNYLLDLGLTCKGFRMGHINVQGVSNKIDQVRLLLESDKNLIHVLGLSETKLNGNHPESVFEINGYQTPYRRDRKTNSGGGLLIYIKNGVSASRRSDLEHENLECIWTEVKPVKSKSFLVGNIYRPPNSSIQWNAIFEDCMETVLREEKEIYIMGDINRDLLNNQIKTAWTDYMEPFGLTQLVSEATRVTSDSRTLIDHIYSNCPENVTSLDVPKIGLSDHYPIFFTRKMHVQPPKMSHYTISYRSFKHFDELKFVEDLQSVPWDTIKLFDDTDDILEAWLDLFLQVVDKHVPLKQHRVRHKNQPQWLSSEILEAMKCRDRHKSLGNHDEYKVWRNKVIKLIQNGKKTQYQTFISNNKGNPSSIYKLFKEVGAGKGPQKQSTIGSIKTGETLIEDSTEIASEFNNFFVNVASKLKEPITSTNHDKLKEFCQEKLPPDMKFEIPIIGRQKVLKFLSNIDINKATGTDMIGPCLLKYAAPFISDEITFICNQSIAKSVFPSKWKEAKVTPLFKNGPHEDVNNYRPISILPVLSKVLEKHVH